MKISFLIPEAGVFTGGKNWLWWVYEELSKTQEVLLNDCSEDCDFIISMSISQNENTKKFHSLFPQIPLITYNWDWFSFVDKTTQEWTDFIQLMKESKDVWTCSNDTAKLCEELLKIPHFVIYCPALPQEFEGVMRDDGYALMASRRVPYKGWDIFERGCRELGINYISCHPSKFTRAQFIDKIKNCSLVVVASYEESNATMSSIEAAFCKKPLLLSDIEANKECWGDCAIYFRTGDLQDFKDKIKDLFINRNFSLKTKLMVEEAYMRAMKMYTPEIMSENIITRLNELRQI
jgi:hypothetical protein